MTVPDQGSLKPILAHVFQPLVTLPLLPQMIQSQYFPGPSPRGCAAFGHKLQASVSL